MTFILKKQAINILIIKYGVGKSLVKTIENKVNFFGAITNSEDFFNLIECVVRNISNTMSQIKDFSNGNDKIILNMSIDDFIAVEINRLHGSINFGKNGKKIKVKKRIVN